MRFAIKFSENLGMADYFSVNRIVALPRVSSEVFYSLDPNLYCPLMGDTPTNPKTGALRNLSDDSLERQSDLSMK